LRNLDDVFAVLARSSFRRRQRLGAREAEYLETRGLPIVVEHARDLIARRLAPAEPRNDGKQTPFKGHPVFVAQHATATCCRGCLEKLHGIPRGKELTREEQEHVVAALERWLSEYSPT
jgi:uncharacterized protein DUF4186